MAKTEEKYVIEKNGKYYIGLDSKNNPKWGTLNDAWEYNGPPTFQAKQLRGKITKVLKYK